MEKMSNVKAIKVFFETGEYGRKTDLSELKALSKYDREELGELARAELERGIL